MNIGKKIHALLGLGLLSTPLLAGTEQTMESSFFDNDLNLSLLILAIVQLLLFISVGYITNKISKEKGLWFNKNKTFSLIFIASLLGGNELFAADAVASTDQIPSLFDGYTYLLISINVVLLVVNFYLSRLSKQLLVIATGVVPKKKSSAKKVKELTLEELEEELMTDHEYDGIRELDNNMPTWWIGMFYASIVFALVYIPYYHFSDAGLLQEEEYLAEMEQAKIDIEAYMEKKGGRVDETNVELLTTAKAMKNGAEIFTGKCAACHGQAGEGGVGPNLTDRYWLHGGDIKAVFASIKYGIPSKGMIAWKSQLTPAQIAETASYILSLQGSNPANAKAPQGDLVE